MWEVSKNSLQDDETIEFEDRPSKLSCMFSYVWAGFMLLSFVMVPVVLSSSDSRGGGAGRIAFAYLIMALPAIYFILKRFSTIYAITNKGIITRTGIITTSVKSVPYKFITSTAIKETIMGKLFNYANVVVDTAGSGGGVEVQWQYLKSAHRVKKLIDSKILKL